MKPADDTTTAPATGTAPATMPEAAPSAEVLAEPAPQTEPLAEPRLEPLIPPGAHRILVGIAGWNGPALADAGFYPPGCDDEAARLRHCARHFTLLSAELGDEAVAGATHTTAWAEATPPGFVFSARAPALLSGWSVPVDHLPITLQAALGSFSGSTVGEADLPPALRELLWQGLDEALAPLRAAGKLGAVHLALAPGCVCSPQAREQLDLLRGRLIDELVALEFLHASWLQPAQAAATFEYEKERAFVNVVQAGSPAAHWEVTNPHLAVVRLPDVAGAPLDADRLQHLADELRRLAGRVLVTHVIFDNEHGDQGAQAALRLIALLGVQPPARAAG